MSKRKIRLAIIPTLLISSVNLSSCKKSNTLLLLNWGEYINPDIVEKFEEEYNCIVKESITESNELFYSKLKSGTTVYDLVVPSEYMVKKMAENDLIQPIDLDKLSNYSFEKFVPGVQGIITEYSNVFPDFKQYQIPYFWGTWGLMYNKRNPAIEEAIKKYGWDAYFDNKGIPDELVNNNKYRKGMYNVPRNAYAASMFHNNLSPNVEGKEYLDLMKKDLLNADFVQWGTDGMKKDIQNNLLDVAYVWTGDFLDVYYETIKEGTNPKDILFDIYIPEKTIAFMDSIVVTKKAIHMDLAYKFINFLLRPEIAMENASYVGYCTPNKEAYESIVSYKDTASADSFENAWGNAYNKYYPEYLYKEDGITLADKQFKGVSLTNFDKNYLTDVTNIFNSCKLKN